ncbi:hypothetical protein IFR04_004034 [Cadophora malorum]|uniref:Hydrophobin n=1 Tax=Cadophora malorum TaxID=108018 RepID=A0A8H8BSW0_9HELO|nr:hypothetical protein IFR04_004034 [Cadophora malorum]
MLILPRASSFLLLISQAFSYPTSYPPEDATQSADVDSEPPTATYIQPIDTAIDSPSPPVYYPPANTPPPAQSYTNPVPNPNPPSYTTISPPSAYSLDPTTSTTTDCPDPVDLYSSTVQSSTVSQTQTLTLTTPLVILPASPSSSPTPSPTQQTHCNKCCPQPPIEDENGRKGDWLSGLGMLLARELEEEVQRVVGRVEGRCGLLGGRGGAGHGVGGGNLTMITGCSVFAGGVICGWSSEGK